VNGLQVVLFWAVLRVPLSEALQLAVLAVLLQVVSLALLAVQLLVRQPRLHNQNALDVHRICDVIVTVNCTAHRADPASEREFSKARPNPNYLGVGLSFFVIEAWLTGF
jgi:hypothetical protein